MAVPTFVQMIASTTNLYEIYGNTNTANDFEYTLPNAVQAGNALLILCTYDNGVGGLSFTDNINGSWPAATITVENAASLGTYSAAFLLTGALAGVTTIEAVFTGSTPAAFQWNIIEYANVTGQNGSHGTASVAGPNLTTGSFTPTNNNASGGNLIVSYFANNTLTSSTTGPNPWVVDSGHTFLEADMTAYYQATVGGFAHATQYFQQNTAAAINPSMTATGDTTNSYNCLAIALKAGATGNGPPTSGAYVAKVIHQSITTVTASTTLKLQIPWTGNLRFISCFTGQVQTFTSLTDSDSYSWTNKASAVDDLWAYAANTAADTNATLSIALGATGGGNNYTFRSYDIWNAATSPYDNYVTNTGYADGATTLNTPSITPVGSRGLTIAGLGLEVGPGLSVTAPSGAIFDMIAYANEVDQDNYDNADLQGHYYFSSNAAQNWSWTTVSETPNPYWAYAITFLSASTAPSMVFNQHFNIPVTATVKIT